MAGQPRRRDRGRYEQRLHTCRSVTQRVGVGVDYLRAQLGALPPDKQQTEGERIERLLFDIGDTLTINRRGAVR
jgi:hypothetical protein